MIISMFDIVLQFKTEHQGYHYIEISSRKVSLYNDGLLCRYNDPQRKC